MLPPRLGWRKGVMLPCPVSKAALRLVLAALASAPATLSGCGSATLASDDPGDPGETAVTPRPVDQTSRLEGVPLEELADRLARAYCDALTSCCHAAGLGPGSATCEQRARAAYQAQLDDNAALGLRYQPLAATRCVAAFTHFVLSCSYETRPASDAACGAVFQGTRALDEACDSDAQCAQVSGSGVYCAGNLGPQAHTCQRALGEGEQCLLEGCDQGLFCDFSVLTCQPQQTGGDCFQFDACARGSACSPNNMCEPTLANGQSCVLDLQCESGSCGDGGCAATFVNASSCASP